MSSSDELKQTIDPLVSNIPLSIIKKVGRNLHIDQNHPICIIKNKIYKFFKDKFNNDHTRFKCFDHLSPVVSVLSNFDNLLIPSDHPCRKKTDTYYVNKSKVLRTQTSAHQVELMNQGYIRFLVTGDVYRKDEIDKTHYPVFHQMEGVCLNQDQNELLKTMEELITYLFPNHKININKDYFPFTNPSFEIEVECNGKLYEVAGCGMIRKEILDNIFSQNNIKQGWAFGLGLERLAMILFNIPDIRMFWSEDPKFLDQFSYKSINKFVPYSNLSPQSKDLSFFILEPEYKTDNKNEHKTKTNNIRNINTDTFTWDQENNFFDICRECDENNMIESVKRFDVFFHPKRKLMSVAYRVIYTMDTSFNNPSDLTETCNLLHSKISSSVGEKMNVEMRSK